VLAQARPELDEGELGALLGTVARPLVQVPLTAQGAGALDLKASAETFLIARPRSLAFPLLRGRRSQAGLKIELKNLGKRKQLVAAYAHSEGSPNWLRVQVRPNRVLIKAGRHAIIRVRVRLVGKRLGSSAQGTIALLLSGGRTLHVPWAVRTVKAGQINLISRATLSRHRLSPTDKAPTILALGLGSVIGVQEREIKAATRVDVELWNADGRYLGVLARLRDVLPGHYVFGLTGLNPAGAALAPGDYRLRIVAVPSGGGKSSIRVLRITVTPARKTQQKKAGTVTRKSG
jgi:hypothetical protein